MVFSKKWLAFLLAMVFVLMLAACSSNNESQDANVGSDVEQQDDSGDTGKENTAEQPEVLELSIYHSEHRDEKVINNPNDIVTPVVEEKFGIRFSEVHLLNNNQPFRERLNQFVAVGEVPDVLIATQRNADYAVSTGKFAELGAYIDSMENFNKYFPDRFWPNFLTDGKKYALPITGIDYTDPKYANDPYILGPGGFAIWAREDILRKAGYNFTPLKELQQKVDNGEKLTIDDFQLKPAVDTPENFYEMLRKIKDLDLSVGDRPLIPFTIPSWAQFHFGTMYDFGHWRIDEAGNVDGFLGTPEAKEYYHMLTKLYREELIDKDFIIQKDEQLQSKVASGQAAAGMWVPDLNAAMDSMRQINPDWTIRYIPWPKKHDNLGFYDIFNGGYMRILISNELKPEQIQRLIDYFDWTMSDEGMDLLTWGPESSGLWEIRDGKKVMTNQAMLDNLLKGTPAEETVVDYGLNLNSKAAVLSPANQFGTAYNPAAIQRSYPPQFKIIDVNRSTVGGAGFNMDGRASYGDGTEPVNNTSSYFWSKFQSMAVGELLVAKNDEEFNAAWNKVYADFEEQGMYPEAKQNMKAFFEKYLSQME